MDCDRFRKRAHDLQNCAQLVKDLTRIPDRWTEKDFRWVTDLMTGAANDIEELIKATPTGCICRRIQDDNYDYLDYTEGCQHHRQLYMLRESLKANYEKMERALKNEVRMRLVEAALSGMAQLTSTSHNVTALVTRAFAIADETLRQITAEAP
jgi:alkyl sulfatase BDS1-like metallo-beta-lactamase superfamily hydrolase